MDGKRCNVQAETNKNSKPEPTDWWNRPCGGRDVLAVAFPLIVQTCFWSIMWFIDRLFLSWYSNEATAAALPGGMYHWTMICLPAGIASYANTFVAQYYGAGRTRRVGNAVQQAIWFGWATVPLFLLSIPLAPWIFQGTSDNPAVVQQEVIYFQVLALGAGAMVITGAQSCFYTGRGLTGIVMLVNCIGTLLDISLEYTFIFGAFGFPRLGIAGAGLTTAISNWATVLMFWLLMRRPKERAEYGLDDHHFDWTLFRRLIRFGLPSGFPQLVESVAFSLLTISIARISDIAGAATSIALTINAAAFVPMIGVNITVSTLVGQKLGENRPDLAARATWTAIVLGMAYTGLFAILYLAIPNWFLVMHTAFAAEDFTAVRETIVVLLRFVALYCFFDAMQIVLIGALRGAGDTRFILLATSLISILSVTIGRFAENYFQWREYGIALWGWWWILTGWILALGLVYLLRFLGGKWKDMRVIEPELADAAPPPEVCLVSGK
jgi:MATE family multidrug resistance protein